MGKVSLTRLRGVLAERLKVHVVITIRAAVKTHDRVEHDWTRETNAVAFYLVMRTSILTRVPRIDPFGRLNLPQVDPFGRYNLWRFCKQGLCVVVPLIAIGKHLAPPDLSWLHICLANIADCVYSRYTKCESQYRYGRLFLKSDFGPNQAPRRSL